MTGFAVQPQVLAEAGASVARSAAEVAGAAVAVREALSQVAGAAGHRGVASAAEDAGDRWRSAVQGWALGAEALGTALAGAATSYLEVDSAQAQGLAP